LNLLDGKRKFCHEGFVTQTTTSANKTKTAKRYLFLFNNLLIITKHVKQGSTFITSSNVSSPSLLTCYDFSNQATKSKSNSPSAPETKSKDCQTLQVYLKLRYITYHRYDALTLSVCHLTASKFNFSFTHQREKFTFSTKTSEEKAQWLTIFTVQLQEHDKDKGTFFTVSPLCLKSFAFDLCNTFVTIVFGMPLTDLLAKENRKNQIPRIVEVRAHSHNNTSDYLTNELRNNRTSSNTLMQIVRILSFLIIPSQGL